MTITSHWNESNMKRQEKSGYENFYFYLWRFKSNKKILKNVKKELMKKT